MGLVLEAWWPGVGSSSFEMATVCGLLWRVYSLIILLLAILQYGMVLSLTCNISKRGNNLQTKFTSLLA